ncbi:MAG: HEPN domain-containing protein [SAR324 cluster bacterium]|nr:HEPN domain-containing protein [SAR324 cluster bacterium]
MDDKEELVKNWLIKAQHDLLAAKKLSNDPESYADVAIYHCQQAGEKAVKGFLVLQDQEFPKTHDIRLLVQLAIRINPSFQQYQETAEILTPYATEFRYPGDLLEPTSEELQDALKKAEEIFNFVASLLSEEIRHFLNP